MSVEVGETSLYRNSRCFGELERRRIRSCCRPATDPHSHRTPVSTQGRPGHPTVRPPGLGEPSFSQRKDNSYPKSWCVPPHLTPGFHSSSLFGQEFRVIYRTYEENS